MNKLRWLHLSDIHFNFENYDTLRVRDATLDYLKDEKFDFIVVTGDIAYQGKGYEKGVYDFLNQIRNQCLDDTDSIFIIPGNHDLKRSPLRSNIIEGINSKENPSKYVTDEMDKDTYDILLQPFNGFFEFYKNIKATEYPKDKLHFIEKRQKFNIIHINTCLLSGIDKEEGKLVFDQKKLYEAVKDLKNSSVPNIAVGHHTVECFSTEEQRLFENSLSDCNIDIYLSGHVHVPGFSFHQNNINDMYAISCGSGISDGWASVGLIFGCIELETGNSSAEFHKWSKDQRWIVDNEAFRKAPNGKLEFSIKRFSKHGSEGNPQTSKAESNGIRSVLFDKSKEYYAMLNGPGGRFHHLDISDIILPGLKKDFIDISVNVNDEGQIPLNQSVELLWKKDVRHAFIVGEGGMGKTVSLIRSWREYLERDSKNTPVPIYIGLNEYNTAPEAWKQSFIINTIGFDYLGIKNLSEDDENRLWDLLRNPCHKGNNPSVILLLDGLNEVTVNRSGLLIELNRLIKNCSRGTQIIMTSRLDMRGTLNLNDFNLLELTGLCDEQIKDYCRQFSGTPMPQGRLLDIVKNPMMLTIYMSTCRIVQNNMGNTGCEFKEKVQSSGELLWNFIGSIVFKHSDNYEKSYYYKYILRHLLPYLGWKMELEGKFYLSLTELKSAINDSCVDLCKNGFFDAFPFFIDYEDKLCLGKLDEADERKRFAGFKKAIVEELAMMVEEKGTYRFLHQNFRDYFSAVHILNMIQICLDGGGALPDAVKNKDISYYVRNYIGEIEGEQYNIPIIDYTNKCWSASHYKDTRLIKLLDRCRNIFDKSIGYAVWNILEIWKSVRGELTGASLYSLDLSNVVLNGVRCSRAYGDKVMTANFDRSILDERNILPQGHSDAVNSAVYSRDGKRILSASWDKSIKEWDAITGECIRTFDGHSFFVTSAVYSGDGKRILSASWDKSIKEWDTVTGECMRTYNGHSDFVNSAVYSGDGKRILSASRDKSIKEWDAATGECMRTYNGHSDEVNSVVYSGDGKHILSASRDNSIKEWDVITGECIRTYDGHSNSVNSAVYSVDGKRILSASWDSSIKEWDAVTGECRRTYECYPYYVNSAVYSSDGKRILSTSWDFRIKEWDAVSGECIRTFDRHSSFVNSAVYSGDGKRILSASSDNSIKEWDAITGECIRTYEGHSDEVNSAVYSGDGKCILSASEDNSIKEWDAVTNEHIRTYAGHSSPVKSAVYSSDGKRILSASWDNSIKEWDTATCECIRTYEGHPDFVNNVVYSGDSKRILSSSRDKSIKEWDTVTCECIRTYEGHSDSVNSAVYSGDGKRILSASDDNTIKEWDVVTGECIRTYEEHSCSVNSAVYSGDGKRILSTSIDNSIKEWDTVTCECIRTYEGHSSHVKSAVYSRDGKRILSASDDNTIKEWDAVTGECIRSISNISGLMIKGCSFRNLYKDSNISPKCMEIMKTYGAKEISIEEHPTENDNAKSTSK